MSVAQLLVLYVAILWAIYLPLIIETGFHSDATFL
jgi:hypothetical protein